MLDLGDILAWLRARKMKKSVKIAEGVLKDLHALTVTMHGRILLAEVCEDEDNDLAPELRHIFWVLLSNAPLELCASLN